MGWRQDTLSAMGDATFSIGTDASYSGQNFAIAAFVVHHNHVVYHQHIRACSAHSSFNGEFLALYDTIAFMSASLIGWVLIIMDNLATMKAATDNSTHSGFAISLNICKVLDHWFQKLTDNYLEIRWFPSHTDLIINEAADTLAGSSFPFVCPKPITTTASRKRTFMADTLHDW